MTEQQEQRARDWIAGLELQLQNPQIEFPAEVLNALLRIVDYPRRCVMDFQPGSYSSEVGERIVRLAGERLHCVVTKARGGPQRRTDPAAEMLFQEIERLQDRMARPGEPAASPPGKASPQPPASGQQVN